jgi:cullin 4
MPSFFTHEICLADHLNFVTFTETPQLPQNYQEETWKKLEEAVVAMQTSKSIRYSQEELFQGVENMCNHKMAQFLYTSLRGEF